MQSNKLSAMPKAINFPFLKRTFMTGCAIVVSFAFFGCGGDGGGKSSAPATPTTPAATLPTITVQPTSQIANAGATATFSVAATGTAPLAYQWRKNSSDITGATSTSYTPPALTTSDNGATFSVTVSNSAGSVRSNNA